MANKVYIGMCDPSHFNNSVISGINRTNLAGTNIGNYALFAAGVTSNGSRISDVEAFNTSLTKTTPTSLNVARSRSVATNVGNYALFAGGCWGYSNSYLYSSNEVEAYDKSLTRTLPTDMSADREDLAATNVGNYALFAGGSTRGSNGGFLDSVDAYNTSLTRSTATSLPAKKSYSCGGHSIGHAIFAGGYDDGGATNNVYAYDTSLTRSILTELPTKVYNLISAYIGDGNYTLFAGGNSSSDVVYAYDVSLTRLTRNLSSSKSVKLSSRVNQYVAFSSMNDTNLEIFSPTLTRSLAVFSDAYLGRYDGASASVGGYGLFAEGYMGGTRSEINAISFTDARNYAKQII